MPKLTDVDLLRRVLQFLQEGIIEDDSGCISAPNEITVDGVEQDTLIDLLNRRLANEKDTRGLGVDLLEVR